ncbi:hypothetical protein ABT300_08920 [Streptomyces sp. NPDC001027]|uniref:hypothetical protein n=1 Tax=Streptomyces sp. NPDC001027 TaxID=3154771 RepID=UPI00332B9DD2
MPSETPCVDCGELSDKRSERCMPCEYKRRQERTCQVIEDSVRCAGAHKSNNMCGKHYQRFRKHGSPLTNVRDAHRAFVRRAAWMDTDECVIPP